MNIKLSAIQIFVSDWKKAKKWYSEILGMKLIGEYPENQAAWMKLDDIDFYIETPNSGWGEGWNAVRLVAEHR
jgi:catechol 2,3-dioxygenase-like lactoylglutathione lyase family enzyme